MSIFFRGNAKMFKIKELVNKFLTQKKANGIKQSTISTYSYILESQILPVFPLDVRMLTKEYLEEIVSNIIQFKSKTVIIILKDLLSYMYEFNYISYVPKITVPKTKRKTHIDIFTLDEQQILIDHLSSHYNNFNFCLLLSLYTGIRIGELCALQFKDISNNIIQITKTLQRIKNIGNTKSKTKIIIDKPKSQSSIREIPIPQNLFDKLELLEKENDNSYILTGKSNYLEPRSVERKFKKVLKECNILYRNFHVLRHTFATNAIAMGLDYKILSDILGHSSIKTTLDLYVHTNNRMKTDFINQLCTRQKVP